MNLLNKKTSKYILHILKGFKHTKYPNKVCKLENLFVDLSKHRIVGSMFFHEKVMELSHCLPSIEC